MHCARSIALVSNGRAYKCNTLKKKKATYRPFIRPDKPIIDSYIKAIDSIKL